MNPYDLALARHRAQLAREAERHWAGVAGVDLRPRTLLELLILKVRR